MRIAGAENHQIRVEMVVPCQVVAPNYWFELALEIFGKYLLRLRSHLENREARPRGRRLSKEKILSKSIIHRCLFAPQSGRIQNRIFDPKLFGRQLSASYLPRVVERRYESVIA